MRSLILLFCSVLLLSCDKDQPIPSPAPDPVVTKNASITVNFSAVVAGKPLVPITKYYPIGSSEIYSVTKFNYYVSNVRLKREDGSFYTEPNSYHLIKHLDSLTSFVMNDIPAGNYVAVDYMIGVDSVRNVSGVQSGALDPANLMFWDWNTGYIFFKLEGRYSSPSAEDQEYAMHVGGFQAPYSCLQSVSLNFPQTLVCVNDGKHKIAINTSVDEIFVNPLPIDFDYYYAEVVKGSKIFQDISKNYRDMFKVTAAN